MTATPRFALSNLSNTKNPIFSSNIFKNLQSNIEKTGEIPNFFTKECIVENSAESNIEKKFGSSYEINEVFL